MTGMCGAEGLVGQSIHAVMHHSHADGTPYPGRACPSGIWEPFHTTKAEGTGLGLSIVRSLVGEQPGARLAVASEVGKGTTFSTAMPASDRPRAAA